MSAPGEKTHWQLGLLKNVEIKKKKTNVRKVWGQQSVAPHKWHATTSLKAEANYGKKS